MGNLKEAFHTLQNQYSALFADATYLAEGRNGVAVTHGDGTISKIMIRKPDAKWQKWSEQELQKEVSNLALLHGSGITGFQMPELLSEATTLISDQFYATYRMTEIKGHGASLKEKSSLEISKLFQQAGEALGEFHQRTSSMTADWTFSHLNERGAVLHEIPRLPPKVNDALKIGDVYLKENLKSSVIHGDFHPGNILLHDNKIVGLIDFSQTGPSANYLTDMMGIPDSFFPDFIKGYEIAGGEHIDPDMVAFTKLNMWSGCVLYPDTSTEAARKAMKEIYKNLEATSHITGFKMPSLP